MVGVVDPRSRGIVETSMDVPKRVIVVWCIVGNLPCPIANRVGVGAAGIVGVLAAGTGGATGSVGIVAECHWIARALGGAAPKEIVKNASKDVYAHTQI